MNITDKKKKNRILERYFVVRIPNIPDNKLPEGQSENNSSSFFRFISAWLLCHHTVSCFREVPRVLLGVPWASLASCEFVTKVFRMTELENKALTSSNSAVSLEQFIHVVCGGRFLTNTLKVLSFIYPDGKL